MSDTEEDKYLDAEMAKDVSPQTMQAVSTLLGETVPSTIGNELKKQQDTDLMKNLAVIAAEPPVAAVEEAKTTVADEPKLEISPTPSAATQAEPAAAVTFNVNSDPMMAALDVLLKGNAEAAEKVDAPALPTSESSTLPKSNLDRSTEAVIAATGADPMTAKVAVIESRSVSKAIESIKSAPSSSAPVDKGATAEPPKMKVSSVRDAQGRQMQQYTPLTQVALDAAGGRDEVKNKDKKKAEEDTKSDSATDKGKEKADEKKPDVHVISAEAARIMADQDKVVAPGVTISVAPERSAEAEVSRLAEQGYVVQRPAVVQKLPDLYRKILYAIDHPYAYHSRFSGYRECTTMSVAAVLMLLGTYPQVISYEEISKAKALIDAGALDHALFKVSHH